MWTEHFICEFYALTCIHTKTTLVELSCIDTKSSDVIAKKFENMQVVHNNRGKLMGYVFAHILHVLGMKDVPATSKNPQYNDKCECIH